MRCRQCTEITARVNDVYYTIGTTIIIIIKSISFWETCNVSTFELRHTHIHTQSLYIMRTMATQ